MNKQSTPDELRSLVLDYLTHSGYIRSAQTFLSDSTVKHIDVDGDEVMEQRSSGGGELGERSAQVPETTVKSAQIRNKIRYKLFCGKIDEAAEIINEHFPSVLSLQASTDTDTKMDSTASLSTMEYAPSTSVHPAHLLLNIRIQAFVEACRTVPLEYPPIPEADRPPPKARPHDDPEAVDKNTALIKSANKLRALANMLPSKQDRERYQKELANVVGLLAYLVPETSSVSGYLSQERREALAEQIDSAILCHLGQPVISRLELQMRRNCTTWGLLSELKVPLRTGASLFPSGYVPLPSITKGSEETPTCPSLDISAFIAF